MIKITISKCIKIKKRNTISTGCDFISVDLIAMVLLIIKFICETLNKIAEQKFLSVTCYETTYDILLAYKEKVLFCLKESISWSYFENEWGDNFY